MINPGLNDTIYVCTMHVYKLANVTTQHKQAIKVAITRYYYHKRQYP
jgi:hypothetical protein